jgi:D-alanine-D-alanine ligase
MSGKRRRGKLKVLALMDQVLLPPDEPGDADLETVEWKTEFHVVRALRELGHDVRNLGVATDLGVIRTGIEEFKPDVVFNLLEDFMDVPIFDQNVVAYLELLDVPYTGCNSRGLMLARDKAITKKILSFHRIPVPEFHVFRMGHAIVRPKKLAFPLIVKSLTKEGSAGISKLSVVDSDQKLKERVALVHKRQHTDAIVERYVDGRELYVGVMGTRRLQVLPVWEMVFQNLTDQAPRNATERVKWDPAYQKKHGIDTDAAKGIPDATVAQIQNLCRRVYRILELSGYARIDLRLDAAGKVYVLEANPNPQIAKGEDFADAAEHAGVTYTALIQRLVMLALEGRETDGA